ncbi:MAG: glucose 1-dehydrogenase [Chloroflexi bacterium]|nr:glucose 1-dehydrogenase [Chloroflexota bacterium]
MTLHGRVAIVTGGARGIGRAISLAFASAGAAVGVNFATDATAAETVVSEIVSGGGRALAVRADQSRSDDVDRLFAEVTRAFGLVDVLVNNAGVFSFQPIEEVTEAEFHRLYATNVLGPIFTMQRFIAQAPARGGSIVNIASAGIAVRGPGSALYTSTKGALVTMTQVLAKELGSRQIRVNAIAPGATQTEGAREVGVTDDSDRYRRLLAATPLGRVGHPEDISPVAVFLASDDARWITGDTLFAAGGIQ